MFGPIADPNFLLTYSSTSNTFPMFPIYLEEDYSLSRPYLLGHPRLLLCFLMYLDFLPTSREPYPELDIDRNLRNLNSWISTQGSRTQRTTSHILNLSSLLNTSHTFLLLYHLYQHPRKSYLCLLHQYSNLSRTHNLNLSPILNLNLFPINSQNLSHTNNLNPFPISNLNK
jgi:hypothetical protein